MTTSSGAGSAVKAGDLVRLDYELWNETGGKQDLLETTREEVAQKAKWSAPTGFAFGPRAHLIAGEYFPAGIEATIAKAKVGEEFEQQFLPAEAFGERDPKLIELFSMHEIERLPEMRRDDAHLDIGTVLTIRGRPGRVASLTAARVRVDFNPSLAGRTVRGKFQIVEPIHGNSDQVRALVDVLYGRGAEFRVETHEKTITIHVPDRAKLDVAWFADKPRIVQRIRERLHPETIRVVEEYVTPKASEPAAKRTKEKSEPPAAETAEPAPAEDKAA